MEKAELLEKSYIEKIKTLEFELKTALSIIERLSIIIERNYDVLFASQQKQSVIRVLNE